MNAPAKTTPVLGLKRLAHALDIALPAYETEGAAGMDVQAAIDEGQPLVLSPGKRALVPTGLVMEIPHGYEVQIRPRSGLALKHGITCLNAPGTVDSDYRGEVKVILANLGEDDFAIERGMRIAQMVVAPVTRVTVAEIEETSQTARGTGGFGSTGV